MALINLSVEYYNEVQRQLFQGFPNATQLNNLVANNVSISKGELLAYMMFPDQRDANGFRTYDDLRDRIQHRLGDIDKYLSFNNESVQSLVDPGAMNRVAFTNRLGVALGLCVTNKIHGLTEADWKIIPETNRHSTFDFEIPIASTGTNFIQVENKGSVVDNNDYKRSAISQHYNAIVAKKNYLREEETKKGITHNQNLFYGTIGVLDTRVNSIAKVWLIDPPAFDIEMKPKKYKLLARLHYYLDEFRNIEVRKKITDALEKRIKQIEAAEDYLSFDNKQLDGRLPHSGNFSLYMDGKMLAIVDSNEAFGRIFIVQNDHRTSGYIIAFPKSIIRLIIKQDFKAILKYNYAPAFLNENVQVLIKISNKYKEQRLLPGNLKFVLNERSRNYEAIYFGKISHTPAGRIFGLL
jgi:hypothetical protein